MSSLNLSFLRANRNNTVKFKIEQAASILTHALYNPKLPTVFYSHGYTESVDSWTVQAIITAYSANGTFNLILVNYGAYSTNRAMPPSIIDYQKTVANINAIGPIVGAALWGSFGANVQKIQLVG
jgi:hypothetical protein